MSLSHGFTRTHCVCIFLKAKQSYNVTERPVGERTAHELLHNKTDKTKQNKKTANNQIQTSHTALVLERLPKFAFLTNISVS